MTKEKAVVDQEDKKRNSPTLIAAGRLRGVVEGVPRISKGVAAETAKLAEQIVTEWCRAALSYSMVHLDEDDEKTPKTIRLNSQHLDLALKEFYSTAQGQEVRFPNPIKRRVKKEKKPKQEEEGEEPTEEEEDEQPES